MLNCRFLALAEPAMLNYNQRLHQPAMQKFFPYFRGELQAACQLLQQENPQNPNHLEKSPASDPIVFAPGPGSSSFYRKFTAFDDDDPIDKYFSGGYLEDNWGIIEDQFFGSEGQAFSLKEHAPPVPGKAIQMLMAEKEPKSFLALVKAHKAMRAKSLGVIDVTGLIPNDPAQKHSFCRALGFSSGFQVPGKYVLKLCVTGNGGVPLLGDQSLDPTANYVVDSPAIKALWSSAREKNLTDLIGQARADCAKKHGKEAEADFLKMVEYCPREVLANFYSVELWDMLTLEDKVKEEFAKLPLCKRPEIIDTPPAAFINHPVPALDFKPSCSTAEGGVKFFLVPDLNEIYVEDEAGESTVAFAIGEEEKANSKKRKADAASGEGEGHVPKIPTFSAIP